MSREGEAVQGAVPREEGFASVLRRDAWVKPFFFRYRKALALALFLGLLTFGFASALMFTSGYLVSASAVVETILFLHLPLIFVRIFGVGKPILQYLERLTSHDWVLRMTSGLRLKLYRALERDAVFFRATHRTGDVLGLLAEDIGHIQNLYLRTVFPTVTAWLLFVVLVACLGWFSLWLALAMLLVLGTAVFLVPLVSVLANAARQARHKQMKNELYAELADNVLGVSDWVFAGRGEEYLTRHKERELRMRDVQERMERFGRRRDVVLQALFGICAVLLLVWAGGRFGGEGGDAANWIDLQVLVGLGERLHGLGSRSHIVAGEHERARTRKHVVERGQVRLLQGDVHERVLVHLQARTGFADRSRRAGRPHPKRPKGVASSACSA